MVLPITTTRITISTPAGATDPYEQPTYTTVATGVPAVIGVPTGREQIVGGQRAVTDRLLHADPGTTIAHNARIIDETTGTTYEVAWVAERYELGIAYLIAGLNVTVGASVA